MRKGQQGMVCAMFGRTFRVLFRDTERLADMHPIDRQAFLEELRHKGRRDDLRTERKELDLPELTDAELDELLGASE